MLEESDICCESGPESAVMVRKDGGYVKRRTHERNVMSGDL
jgi:hypothetical protein